MPPRKSSAKRTASASKKKTVSADTIPASSSPVPAGPTTKRKADVVQSDSDVEVIESARPSKKKNKSGVPAPSSPAYDELPPVFITAKVNTAPLDNSPTITFGSASSQPKKKEGRPMLTAAEGKGKSAVTKNKVAVITKTPDSPSDASVEQDTDAQHSDNSAPSMAVASHTPTPSRPRSKRMKAMTEKARVLHELRSARSSARGQVAKPSDTSNAINSDSEVDVPVAETALQIQKPKSTPNKLPAPIFESDVEVSDGEKEALSAESDVDKSTLDKGVASSDDGGVSEVDEPDDGIAVMSKELQDPKLYKHYKSLPNLRNFCDVQPFMNNSSYESNRVSYSALCGIIGPETKKSLLAGLLFVMSGNFVNTSRVDPARLKVDGDRMKIAGSNHNAVGIMLGVVSECYLFKEGIGGTQNYSYPVHKISIIPFAQEFRRDTSLWGLLFRFRVVAGAVSSHGITFSTRRKEEKFPDGPKTPNKSSGLFMTVTSPLASSSRMDGPFGFSYPASHGFEDRIPMYDGRNGFGFTDAEFRNLSGLPLYRGGKKDLPENAVVAVGYTLSTYVGKKTGTVVLSTNVQFVILLGVPIAAPHM